MNYEETFYTRVIPSSNDAYRDFEKPLAGCKTASKAPTTSGSAKWRSKPPGKSKQPSDDVKARSLAAPIP
jgi:hypothetical protein